MFLWYPYSHHNKRIKTTRKSYCMYEFTILSGDWLYDYAKFY